MIIYVFSPVEKYFFFKNPFFIFISISIFQKPG